MALFYSAVWGDSRYFTYLTVFQTNFYDSKFPRVSSNLLSIQADLNNSVVWMFYTPVLIYKSSSPGRNPLVTVPNAQITIDITFAFMFHGF